MTLRPALTLAAAVVALAACGKKDAAPADTTAAAAATPAAASSNGGDDLADVTSYRLSMDRIDRYLAAQRNIGAKMKAMSPSEREAFKARSESGDESDDSLDGMAKKFDSVPEMRDAIRAAGLSTREFALLTMSMMQTAMASSVLQQRPKDNQDSLVREMKANPDNIKFYREHEAEITRKTNELKAQMKASGESDES